MRRTRLSAILAGCLGLASALVDTAQAQACTGTDATELHFGCAIQNGGEDFYVKVYAPSGTILSSDPSLRNALSRAVVFVHGYGVLHTALPEGYFEDGSAGVFDQLLADKVSIVSLAPGTGDSDRVEDDAQALRAALGLIQGYRGPSARPLIVLGHSMGGLAARIALAEMEADDEAHGVELFVTYDSPHSGVNVPHGMQMLKVKADEWAAMTEEDFIAMDPGWEGVFDLAHMFGIATSMDPDAVGGFPDPTSLQAQQMTIQGAVSPDEYPAFMALLDATGFPEEPHTIAISNGNTQGIGCTQSIAPGSELFYFTGAKGISAASVRGTFQIFTDNPGAYSFKSDVYYDGLFQNHDGGEKNATAPLGLVAMDHLSGGTLDYAQEMLAAAQAHADDFHEPSFRGAADSAIPFVPTSSAFALPVDTADADLATIVAAGGVPFDEVYAIGDLPAFGANIDHNTLVFPGALLDEIAAILTCPGGPTGDRDDDGVDDACDDDDDNDGAFDGVDNCAALANEDQADGDADDEGDACDSDADGDGTADGLDNCPGLANADQADVDEDGVGDPCDPGNDSYEPSGWGCFGCTGAPAGNAGLTFAAMALARLVWGRRRPAPRRIAPTS